MLLRSNSINTDGIKHTKLYLTPSQAKLQQKFILNWILKVTKSLSKKLFLKNITYVRFQSAPCVCLTQQFLY